LRVNAQYFTQLGGHAFDVLLFGNMQFFYGTKKGTGNVHLRKSVMETPAMIMRVFRKERISRTQVFELHARFKAGWTSIEDDQHTDRNINYSRWKVTKKIKQITKSSPPPRTTQGTWPKNR
jgi:hypothetical protein